MYSQFIKTIFTIDMLKQLLRLLVGIIFLLLQTNIAFAQDEPYYEVCRKGAKFGVCDGKGKVVVAQVYDAVHLCQYVPLILVAQGGKYGLIDYKGKIQLPIIYSFEKDLGNPFLIDETMAYFQPGEQLIVAKDAKWGVIEYTGKIGLPFEYEELRAFNDQRKVQLIAKKDGKYGIIDYNGKTVLPFSYSYFIGFWDFNNKNYAVFSNNNTKWEFVDMEGIVIKDLSATINKNNPNYRSAERFRKNKKWGAVSWTGSEVVQFGSYDSLSFALNLGGKTAFIAKKTGKYGVVNTEGKEIVPLQYEEIDQTFGNNSIAVRQQEKWGLVDFEGKIIIPFMYEEVRPFYGDGTLALARKNGKYGFINKQGKEVISFKYDYADSFRNGKAIVVMKGKRGEIDLQGKETW